jgi:hypothetical protein
MKATSNRRDAAEKGMHGSRALGTIFLLVLSSGAVARPDLYSNGPFVTNPTGGAGGAALSAIQTNLANITQGISSQANPAGDRVADNFVLSSAATISSVVVYAFQTNSTTSASTFTSVNLRIWSGRPGDPGSVIVFGDTTTNRLVSAAWTGCYRARDDAATNTQRPIFAVQASVTPAAHLAAGTYWLDWQMSGTLSGGPMAAMVTVPGQVGPANANARWKSGSQSYWIDVVDGGSLAGQELAFIIQGTPGSGGGGTCYANCDNSTTVPLLNANDFQCFLNNFAAGSSAANCDGSTSVPILNANDFQCFLNRFAGGCT